MGVKEVAAGAEWLDANFPGWEREIDLGTLELQSCTNCILGQGLRSLYGMNGYYRIDSEYGDEWIDSHGFFYPEDESFWSELIKERFSTGNLSDNHVE